MNDDCKKKCQIFTPLKNVNEMLDWIGYKDDLYGRKVLEPTFGKGNILMIIVERYINDCLKRNFSLIKIKKGLEADIYGYEYDDLYFKMCLKNLDELCLNYGIRNVNWKLICGDSLIMDCHAFFDYIIGNPPYISYKLLDEETRKFVKENFFVCSTGKFDYCYAFIEKSVDLLNIGGKMAFLIPSSIFKNVFSSKLRNYIKNDLLEIHDYDSQKLFNEEANGKKRNILTTSSVIILKKGSNTKILNYFNELNPNLSMKIKKNNLGSKWIFSIAYSNIGKYRFGDYFKASNSVATLYNKAYVVDKSDPLYYCSESILYDAVSPRSKMLNIKEKIIFPYLFDSGSIKRISVDDFQNNYPLCCSHLKKCFDNLSKRKSDLNNSWFEYGRSQALNDMQKSKLLISIVVTKKVKVYKLSKNMIPYSGIYIVPISDMSLNKAKKVLESKDFYKYIKSVGINASGDSFRITSKDINNYYFD